MRHVEVNIDHRFITLGYSLLRQYCRKIAKEGIPQTDQEAILECIDKMVDYCLLIETQAFIEATAQCDLEVVRGISHQVRNPLTVIGGNVLRLKSHADSDSPVHRIYDTILEENKRLENMVIDMGVYSDLFQKEMEFLDIDLARLIAKVIGDLKKKGAIQGSRVDVEIEGNFPAVEGDRESLETMFAYLLQNSLEAADPEEPHIRISGKIWEKDHRFVQVEIFNNGTPPRPEDIPNLFVPFYSSKPYGTGFGLPIAQVAAHKNLGELFLEPLAGEGTKYVIRLPAHLR